MAPLWVNDPELFLFKGETMIVPQIWRCKRITSPTPLQRSDFYEEKPVDSPQSLVGCYRDWSRANYAALLDYITPRRLAVNCEGLTFQEIFKIGEDGNINVHQHLYLRSLVVLNMDKYGLIAPKISFATDEYLGKAAPLPDSCPSEELINKLVAAGLAKLTSKVENLEADKIRQEVVNQKLESRVAALETDKIKYEELKEKLVADLASLRGKVENLEAAKIRYEEVNQKLVSKVADLEADNIKNEEVIQKLVSDVTGLKAEKIRYEEVSKQLDSKVVGLEAEKLKYEEEKQKLVADLSSLRGKFSDLEVGNAKLREDYIKLQESLEKLKNHCHHPQSATNNLEVPHWMNNSTNPGLRLVSTLTSLNYNLFTWSKSYPLTKVGTNFTYDGTTNVKPEYFYKGCVSSSTHYDSKVVKLDDLGPQKEKAAFAGNWALNYIEGSQYMCRTLD